MVFGLKSSSDSARLSSHPEIGPLHLPPHLYGQVFYDRAMSALGCQGGVPSRETVTALLLLSLAAFGAGKDMDMRMWRRMAVELAVEMGLHKVRLRPLHSISQLKSSRRRQRER